MNGKIKTFCFLFFCDLPSKRIKNKFPKDFFLNLSIPYIFSKVLILKFGTSHKNNHMCHVIYIFLLN